jgi:hypothetical protein
VGWSAFAILIVTGLINMNEIGVSLTDLNVDATSRTLSLKLTFVILSGLAAALHSLLPHVMRRRSPLRGALTGILAALALLAALAAAFYGVVIAEH